MGLITPIYQRVRNILVRVCVMWFAARTSAVLVSATAGQTLMSSKRLRKQPVKSQRTKLSQMRSLQGLMRSQFYGCADDVRMFRNFPGETAGVVVRGLGRISAF